MIVSSVRLMLISPRPSETGTIRRRMWRTCGLPKPSRKASPIAASRAAAAAGSGTGRSSPPARPTRRPRPVARASRRRSVDQQHSDDHEVPGHRREGRDAEDPLGVEDAGDDAGQPQDQHHDREQERLSEHHQVGGARCPGPNSSSGISHGASRMNTARDRAQPHGGRPQHHPRDAPRLASPRPSRAAPRTPARRPR